MTKFLRYALLALVPFGLPTLAFAHEVYVLDEATIAAGMAATSPNPFTAYIGNEFNFFFWGFVSFVTFSTILFASIFRVFEKMLDPLLFSLKRFALLIVRLTVGSSLLIFGFYGVLYGPEIPLSSIFGGGTLFAQIFLSLLGIGLIAGVYVRTIALASLVLYLCASYSMGWYVLTYANHVGAYILLLTLGSGTWSLGRHWQDTSFEERTRALLRKLQPLAFPILRITFGLSIIFAALYAKYFHSQLALDVVHMYGLTAYFPFEPLFIVLGALIIEVLAGAMLVFGIEVRWTSLFLLFWLILGQMYTQEQWWVHIILFGVGIAIFCHGYDRYSLEGRFFKRHGIEPTF